MSDTQISISLEPGADPVSISALEALQTAEARRKETRFHAVEHICRQLMAAGEFVFQSQVVLLMAAMQMERPRCAIEMARLVAAGDEVDPGVVAVAAYALRMFGQHAEALEVLDRAIRLHPRAALLRERRGQVLADMNRPQEAVSELRQALAMDLDNLGPYLYLGLLGQMREDDVQQLRGREIPPQHRVSVFFALASYHRRQGNLHREFEYLKQANEAAAENHAPWDLQRYSRETAQLIELFTEDFRDSLSLADGPQQRPVFVVGMPRSGSTLVQQILGSHPAVGVAGETPAFEAALLDRVLPRYPGSAWPQLLRSLTPDDLAAVAQAYVDDIAAIYTDAGVFVDKNLNNFRYVGLLAAMFPEARFILTQRQPMATILSCYQNDLGNMHYADDLENLAHVYLRQQRLGAHWMKLFPDRCIQVSYEELVAEPEAKSRALVEFLGLPWGEQVSRFHENRSVVSNSSLAQVRQPLYDSSVDRWRDYAHYLEPARLVLDGLDERVKPSGPIFG